MADRAMVFEFDHAIVRKPGPSVVNGLRAVDIGVPHFEQLLAEHDAYVEALKAAGLAVQVLPADEFADSVFVEDPALVFGEGAIVLRPGAASRRDETQGLAPVLADNFAQVLSLPAGGFAEGGDMLTTPDAVLIGLSSRTNRAGAQSVVRCLEQLGRKGKIVETPPDILHFKTDCSLLDDETVLTTARLAASGVFAGFKAIIVPEGEEAAANALRINDDIFVGADFPRTIDVLDRARYSIVALHTAEIGKVDAGLSCMSLRWHSIP